MPNENLRSDIEGYDLVTKALMDLVNTYPGLEPGEVFQFATLPVAEGIAIFPGTGSFIYDERESIIGHVTQMCQYPFTVLYRASGLNHTLRVTAKEWLDTFGRWIERQPVQIDGSTQVLESWPELTQDRVIREVSRQSPAYLSTVDDDKTETWVMDAIIRYRNEFDR